MSAALRLVAVEPGGRRVAPAESVRPDRAAADEDDALMARVAEGDQRAFARLVARHSPRAQALAHRFTGSGAEAEEVVQEAFWRVWRTAGRWTAGGAMFSTWLHRVVVNLCVDHDRRRRIRRLLPFADAFDPPSEEVGAERAVTARDEMAVVRADIARLPVRQRGGAAAFGRWRAFEFRDRPNLANERKSCRIHACESPQDPARKAQAAWGDLR